jgi:Arc/MetJ family transcription regulator
LKTTIDIPNDVLADAMRLSGSRTKREAVLVALQEYNRQRRMADLARHAGSCSELMTVEELREARQA